MSRSLVKAPKETAVAFLSRAKAEIEKAKTVQEVRVIRNKAEAIKQCLIQSESGLEVQNEAAEIKLRAERKGGQLLASMDLSPGRPKQNSVTLTELLGVESLSKANNLSSRWQLEHLVPNEHFEIFLSRCRERRKEITQSELLRIAKSIERKRRLRVVARPRKTKDYEVIKADFRELKIKDASVDAIITDPPYPKEFIHLYGDLSLWANGVLVDGGHCVVMCGQCWLPQVLWELTKNLDYQWTLCYLTRGASTQIFGRRIKSNWKPVVWLTKGKNKAEHNDDVIRSEGADKRYHEWGQDVSGFVQLIERFTLKRQLVVDPFCGAGTTGVAALISDRQFLGCDIDKDHIKTAADRLYKAEKQCHSKK